MGLFSKRAARQGQHRADPESSDLADPASPSGRPAFGPTAGTEQVDPARRDPVAEDTPAGQRDAAVPPAGHAPDVHGPGGWDGPATAMAWSATPEVSPLAAPQDGVAPVAFVPAGDGPGEQPTDLVAPLDAPVEIVPVSIARPEPALHATGLGVAADGQWIFTGVELLVRRATVAAVVGPQGSGRSSLLLAVTGRMAVSAGTAAVAGVLVTTDAPAVRQMTAVARLGGVVGLEPSLTVAESVDERCLIDGVQTAAGRVRYAEAARVLGLAVPDYLLVRDLTQEEATLLAVAVACVRPSDLIVLDDLDHGLTGPAQHRVVKALSRLSLVGPAVLVSTVDGWPVKNAVATMVTLPPRDRALLLRPVERVLVVPTRTAEGVPSSIAPPSIDPASLQPAPVEHGPGRAPVAPAPAGGPIVADPAFAPAEHQGAAQVAPAGQQTGPLTAPVAFPVDPPASARTDIEDVR